MCFHLAVSSVSPLNPPYHWTMMWPIVLRGHYASSAVRSQGWQPWELPSGRCLPGSGIMGVLPSFLWALVLRRKESEWGWGLDGSSNRVAPGMHSQASPPYLGHCWFTSQLLRRGGEVLFAIRNNFFLGFLKRRSLCLWGVASTTCGEHTEVQEAYDLQPSSYMTIRMQ